MRSESESESETGLDHGYTLSPQQPLGEVHVCTDKGKARTASFVAYDAAFVAVRMENGFKALVG